MNHHRHPRSPLRRCIASVACAATLLVAGACGSDSAPATNNNDNGSTTSPVSSKTFSGTLSDGSAVSLVFAAATSSAAPRAALVVQTRSSAAMTGTVTGTITLPGGSPIQISGTYDPVTGDFSITGGSYALTGTYSNGALQGSCTKAGVTLAFVAIDASSAAVAHYCGTYTGGDAGVLTFVVRGDAAYAFASGAVLTGSVSGSAVTLSGPVSTTNTVNVTGTVSSTAASGSWAATDGKSGTWSASTAECSSAMSTGSLCDKAAAVGAAVVSKLQPCLGSSTPAGGGIPAGTTCLTELAQCNASDAAILSTFLDCLDALPALASTCSTTDVTNWSNAADACRTAGIPQLSASCQAATNIN